MSEITTIYAVLLVMALAAGVTAIAYANPIGSFLAFFAVGFLAVELAYRVRRRV